MCVRIGKPPRVDISALRENYISPELSEDQVEADPFTQVFLPLKQSTFIFICWCFYNQLLLWVCLEFPVKLFYLLQFQKWFDDAVAAALKEPNAMAICTAGKDGKP